MKTILSNKRKSIPMILTLMLILVAISALMIQADDTPDTTQGPPYIQVTHEEVGEDIYRMVVAARSTDSIAVFGVAMSFNNNIVRPISSDSHQDIAIVTDGTLHVSGIEAFSMLQANVQEIPNVWLVRGRRTGFSFGGFTLGGIQAQEYTDLFAFYYRLTGDVTYADFRFENAWQEDSMLGGPGQGQTAFLHPGILLSTRDASFAWGPNMPYHSYTEIPDGNISFLNLDGEPVAARPEVQLNDEINVYEDFPEYDVTIRFNPTIGYLDATDDETIGLDAGTSVEDFPTPYRSGYTFEGWELNGMVITAPFAVNTSVEMEAVWTRNEGTVTLLLNPGQGTWPAGTSSSFSGQAGFVLQSLPSPERAGYVFAGWTLNGAAVSMPFTVNEDKMLIATWTVCNNPTPSPSPSPTPVPCATPTPAPCPTATPAPCQTPAPSPTPCPTPAPSPTPMPSARPNPNTNPIAVSFGIFGAVVLGGLSFIGITALSKKHAVAVGQYNAEAARQKREQRLADVVEETIDFK